MHRIPMLLPGAPAVPATRAAFARGGRTAAGRVRAGLHLLAFLPAVLAFAPEIANAQTSSMYSNLANPAIGMNALFSGQAARGLDEPYGLRFEEAEISLVSVVDPYWTLEGNLVFAGDGTVDPEEVWARSTSIPGIQLKLGKLRGTFGKHGLLHAHAFPFIQAPIIMANTIGGEGFKDAGLEAAWLTPLPWFSEVTGGVYQAVAGDDEHPLDFGSTAHDNVPFLGHFKNQLDLNDATTLELGQSILEGRGSDGRRHVALGADVTFRNVPARNSNRHGWILQGEYLQKGSSGGGTYTREQDGGYASFQIRLSQVWWMGVRAERSRDSFTDFLVDGAGHPIPGSVNRVSANVAWAPSEFSFVRFEYSHAQADAGNGSKPDDDRLMIQMSYTIGHHPAHAY
jgi:hypothetical protein